LITSCLSDTEVIARLTDKVAVVTGAGRGLGLAYAHALAEAGAAVVVNDIDGDLAAQAAESIESEGGMVETHVGPVGSTETADALVQSAVDHFGHLDAMVTNAGVIRDRVLWKMTDDDFDDVVRVHLRGTFTCARSAAIHFRGASRGGRLILVGSPAGQHGNFGQSNYAACKAGITAMARTWAMELARSGVTVNCIIPTAATEMTKTIPAFADHIEAWEQEGTPLPGWLRRDQAMGSVDDVAPLVVFLASEDSAGITGQSIGLGGDRLGLWSYPQEVATEFRDGGWDADAIAGEFADHLRHLAQPFGIGMPEPKT
jgi:NAD(P)-dependent dehydrogenase (short-subunit alcohol dehydrogenase family)